MFTVSCLQTVVVAEKLDGPIMSRFRQLAGEVGIWLSLGGFQEVGPDKEHIYNTHVVLSSDGTLVASYRKVMRIELICHVASVARVARRMYCSIYLFNNFWASWIRCIFLMLRSTTALCLWRAAAQPQAIK